MNSARNKQKQKRVTKVPKLPPHLAKLVHGTPVQIYFFCGKNKIVEYEGRVVEGVTVHKKSGQPKSIKIELTYVRLKKDSKKIGKTMLFLYRKRKKNQIGWVETHVVRNSYNDEKQIKKDFSRIYYTKRAA